MQIDRLEWITHNLLDLSRLDAGLASLEIDAHDLREILRAASQPFQLRAYEKGIRLELELPSGPLVIQADRARLEIAFSNLLENAVKFTPPGGEVRLGAALTGMQAQVWVQDTGPGIPPEDLPHIFERFYRGSVTQAGSGLGLAIAQSVIQAHGGSISVESHPGQGTRFNILLQDSG